MPTIPSVRRGRAVLSEFLLTLQCIDRGPGHQLTADDIDDREAASARVVKAGACVILLLSSAPVGSWHSVLEQRRHGFSTSTSATGKAVLAWFSDYVLVPKKQLLYLNLVRFKSSCSH